MTLLVTLAERIDNHVRELQSRGYSKRQAVRLTEAALKGGSIG